MANVGKDQSESHTILTLPMSFTLPDSLKAGDVVLRKSVTL